MPSTVSVTKPAQQTKALELERPELGGVYNRLFEQKPSLKNEDKSLLRELPNGKKDYAHLFSYILVIKRLLKPEDFYCMKKDIINIKKKYSFVNMKYYGFCDDWEKSL